MNISALLEDILSPETDTPDRWTSTDTSVVLALIGISIPCVLELCHLIKTLAE